MRHQGIGGSDTLTIQTANASGSSLSDSPELERSKDLGFVANAFVGYIRAFSFQRRDTRRQFWAFAGVGLPLGAGVLALPFMQSDPVALFLVGSLSAMLGVWWLLALIAATARRLADAGQPRALAILWLVPPIAAVIAVGGTIAVGAAAASPKTAAEHVTEIATAWLTGAGIVSTLVAAVLIVLCSSPSRPSRPATLKRRLSSVSTPSKAVPARQSPPTWRDIPRHAFIGFIRCFDFETRDSRFVFWTFALIGLLPSALLLAIGTFSGFLGPNSNPAMWLATLIPAALLALWWLLSMIAATARRLSDAGAEPSLALVWLLVPLMAPLNALGFSSIARQFGVSDDGVVVGIMGVWAALQLSNILIACAMPRNRIERWGHGLLPHVLNAVLFAVLPLLLSAALLLGLVALLSGQAVTTKVSGSSRRSSRGRRYSVRGYERKTGATTTTVLGHVTGGLSVSALVALLFVIVGGPVPMWDIRLRPT